MTNTYQTRGPEKR